MELQLRGITKRFPGVLANDRIDLTVRSGEILGLLGENGAGKTTLMNILYGLYSADEGEILIDGEEQHFTGPGDAIAAGIGMVHQHFMLVPVFTVAENVVLGVEPTRRMPAWLAPALAGVFAAIVVGSSFETTNWFGWPAWAWTLISAAAGAALGFLARMVWPFLTRSRGKARRGGSINLRKPGDEVAEISERYSLQVDPEAIIEDLPVGVQQRVEIIKVLFREAQLPGLRRAHRRAHPAGSPGVLRHRALAARCRARASSSSPTSWARCCRSPTASPCCATGGRWGRPSRERWTRTASPR